MTHCPSCKAPVHDDASISQCPNCGALIRVEPSKSPLTARTLNLNEATVEATLDLPQGTTADESSLADVTDQSLEAGTLDSPDLSSSLPKDPLAHPLSTLPENDEISPSSTITIGAAGLTVGRSNAPLPSSTVKASHRVPDSGTVQGGSATQGGATKGRTAGASGTMPNSIDDRHRASLDAGSILSTISKRTLTDGKGDPTTPPDYAIVSKLGEGGMGVVYSAIQKTLDRKVAIKAIKASKATSEESRKKFFYEAQITSDLDHPNIVPIHDMGSNDDGTLFYSMKMVDGTPWEDVIKEKTREENLEIFMKICDAVAFAHARNIIHRDLKPENVMLGAFGEVLVMDWGLAVDLNKNTTFGMSGTPVYMAPEMAQHDLTKIGKTSDIYILGAILFQIVVGRAPHKGKTVRECLANAAKNINVETDIVDPLLDIANHAMALEPRDRFSSVIEFQESIRQHLKYAQSISLAQRAEDILDASIANKDYQGFSKALFSLQDAIELWPKNHHAIHALHRARYAYGQCAFDRGDYDLCLQVLSPADSEESGLIEQAKARKSEIAFRESRFKWMRRAIAALVLFTGASLSLATLYARHQANVAIKSAEAEKIARKSEASAKQAAIEERNRAEEERNRAQKAAEDERVARANEELAKLAAREERDKALIAQEQEKQAKERAVASEQKALTSEQKAVASEKTAVKNAGLALLGNYQSQLNLAYNQSNQFDIAHSSQSLEQVKGIERSLGLPYSLQSWPFNRVALLNNSDLAKLTLGCPLTALQCSPKRKIAVAATSDGRVQVLNLGVDAASLSNASLKFPSSIRSVAVSREGEHVLIAIAPQGASHSVYRWDAGKTQAEPIVSIGKREIQQVAISPDGKWNVAGINAGLWYWGNDDISPAKSPSSLDCRGILQSIHFPGKQSDFLFGLAKLPSGKSYCFLARLEQKRIDTISIAQDLGVTVACMSNDLRHIYFGCDDGRLFVGKLASSLSRSVALSADAPTQNEIVFEGIHQVLPRKHATAIRSIQSHADGTVLTTSEDPVIHFWSPSADGESLDYSSFVTGLPSNVSNAQFMETSDEVIGADDKGNIMQWNVAEQSCRRSDLRSCPTPLIKQSYSTDQQLLAVDVQGVMRTGVVGNQFHYTGHTPGVAVSDLAISETGTKLATIGKRTRLSSQYFEASSETHEICLWDIGTRQMVSRVGVNCVGTCRLSFANSDKVLILCDGKRSQFVPVDPGISAWTEERFGSVLSVPHPGRSNLAALVAASGAVRIYDFDSPAKWDDPGFRYFDLAINNRFVPIEAAWSEDGKRFYILFEHGRIARLEWNDATLSNLSWTQAYSEIRTQEQSEPWHYLDLAIDTDKNGHDVVRVSLRSSESVKVSQLLVLDWKAQEKQPVVVSQGSQPGIWRIFKSPSKPTSDEQMSQSTVQPEIVDCVSHRASTVFMDRQGSLWVKAMDGSEFVVGRPKCMSVSHDQTAKRWLLAHEHGVLLQAKFENNLQVRWSRVSHPLREISSAQISADGALLALVGRKEPAGKTMLVLSRLGSNESWEALEPETAVTDIVDCRWHPNKHQLFLLDTAYEWHSIDIDRSGEPTRIASGSWSQRMRDQGGRFQDSQWLVEPSRDEQSQLYLAILSRVNGSSRIDFLPVDSEESVLVESMVSDTELTAIGTSPTENILVAGDRNGTLGVWFIAPSIDPEPRALFSLVGHRGSAIAQLSFSQDGTTISSCDASNRSIQWYSTKPKR